MLIFRDAPSELLVRKYGFAFCSELIGFLLQLGNVFSSISR
jgi:hypothetical protein